MYSQFKVYFIIETYFMQIKIQECHGKSSIQQEEEDSFHPSKFDLNLSQKLIKCCIWSIAFNGTASWTLGKWIRNAWTVLKCGAGEGWRRSAGQIM
jgi:hypothetical protein